MLMRAIPVSFLRPAMSISLSMADVADDGLVLHLCHVAAVMMSLLPVAVMKMSAVAITSSWS